MHKIFVIIGAAAVAITLQLGAATPTRANPAVVAAAIGFGLLGLAVGAAVAGPWLGNGYGYRAGGRYLGYAGPAAYGGPDHEQACAQAYRSYNPQSDTFLGRDGRRHQCLL